MKVWLTSYLQDVGFFMHSPMLAAHRYNSSKREGSRKRMYNKVDTNMNFVDREKAVEQFWKDNDIFRKSMENRKEG